MADGGGIKGFFKEKVWPLIKMLPKAIIFAFLTGWIYWLFINASWRWNFYLVGICIAIPGYYIVVLLARKIKNSEYPEEALAEEPVEE